MQLRSARVTALVAASLVFGVVASGGAASAGSTPTRTPVSTELVQMTATSLWTPTSPDPMGVTFVPSTGRLLVVDSEVDETPLFQNRNLWETSRGGTVARSGDLTAYTVEPTGIGLDTTTGTYLVSDDDADRINVLRLGPDGKLGTPDDVQSFFSTRPYGSHDPVDVIAVNGDVYWSDGVAREVFHVSSGKNGVFDGSPDKGGDDVLVGHFDVGAYGQTFPEGLGYDAARGTLSVISDFRRAPISEFTLDGEYLGDIDLSAFDIRHPSGIVFARSSDNLKTTSAFITDRGVDNNFNPNENDGRLYEIRVASTPNEAPQITDPGNQSDVEGASVSLQIDATDADGDPMTYAATGLPNGLSIGVTTGLISGTVAAGAHLGSPFTTDVGVGDGQAITHVLLTWTVTDTTAPAMPTALKIRATTRGLQLNWADGPEADVAGYEVSRASSPGGPYTELTGAPIMPSSYRDGSAPVGATSYYQVTALDDSDNVSAPAQRGASRGTIVFHGSSKLSKHAVAITLRRPAAAQTGDLLVATIVGSGSGTITPPAGWTPASSKSSPLHLRESVFTHVVAGGDGATSTFSLGANARSVVGVMVAYAGVDTANPVDVAAGQVNASSTKIVAPSLSPTVTQEVLVGSFGIANGATIKPPMGMFPGGYKALRTWQRKVAVLVADQVMPTTNVTGRRTAKASAAAVNAGIALLLNPAP